MAKGFSFSVTTSTGGRCKFMVEYIKTQPAAFCFVVSLFLIAITLTSLGIYVKGRKEMPDLDAMKNWNAYIGKLKTQDYCFKLVDAKYHFQSFKKLLSRDLNSTFQSDDGTCASLFHSGSNFSQNIDNTSYGTVAVNLTFLVSTIFFSNNSQGVIFSQFTGKNVGTQIRGRPYGSRVDSKIYLKIWIDLTNSACSHSPTCSVNGCLIISAPLTSVPTRMPQIHRDFTFKSKILNSPHSRRPHTCDCREFINGSSSYVYELNLFDNNCSADSPSLLSISKKVKERKSYGVIQVPLTVIDQKKASVHMFIASLTTLVLGIAFTVGVLCTHNRLPKASKH